MTLKSQISNSKSTLSSRLKSRILNLEFRRIGSRSAWHLTVLLVSALTVLTLAVDVYARVGGGQSYGGGGGHGGSGGGGAGALVYLLIRFLLWLTIEHPVIGIPVDIIVIAIVIYWFARPSKKSVSITSTAITDPESVATVAQQQQSVQRSFNQLRRFDPNFSEIIFTDFCYALYGRSHDVRGHGAKALDELSPYLSDAARSSLLQLNSPGLKAVQGIIVGAMSVVNVGGLDSTLVNAAIDFESTYI